LAGGKSPKHAELQLSELQTMQTSIYAFCLLFTSLLRYFFILTTFGSCRNHINSKLQSTASDRGIKNKKKAKTKEKKLNGAMIQRQW
jgi:hypothetical protein